MAAEITPASASPRRPPGTRGRRGGRRSPTRARSTSDSSDRERGPARGRPGRCACCPPRCDNRPGCSGSAVRCRRPRGPTPRPRSPGRSGPPACSTSPRPAAPGCFPVRARQGPQRHDGVRIAFQRPQGLALQIQGSGVGMVRPPCRASTSSACWGRPSSR